MKCYIDLYDYSEAKLCTSLISDSMDVMKKCFEMGKQYGHNRRSDELITWMKKNRRHLRREDVIGYLCGKSPPPRTKPSATLTRANSRASERSSPRPVPRLQSPRLLPAPPDVVDRSDDLQPFRDALALQGWFSCINRSIVLYFVFDVCNVWEVI